MSKLEVLQQIVATYQKYGWTLRRLLLTENTEREILVLREKLVANKVAIEPAAFDAAWFSRLSSDQREAWELRLIGTAPYALFESFERSVSEFERERVRREMELRVRQQNLRRGV